MSRVVVRSLLLAMLVVAKAPAADGTPATEDFKVPASDAGIHLHLHNKHPAMAGPNLRRHVVLFVHGATFPASSTFDVALPGPDSTQVSWMDELAGQGFDVYALDIRGYGGSTRPPAMSQPPEANAPFARASDAVRDIGAAVDFILARRKSRRITLIGWSW